MPSVLQDRRTKLPRTPYCTAALHSNLLFPALTRLKRLKSQPPIRDRSNCPPHVPFSFLAYLTHFDLSSEIVERLPLQVVTPELSRCDSVTGGRDKCTQCIRKALYARWFLLLDR